MTTQTWSKYGFGNIGFLNEDERDLVKEDEWVDGL